MASTTAAINSLQTTLSSTHDSLTSLSSLLEQEFTRQHTTQHPCPNPHTILARLQTLQTQLPTLQEDICNIHTEKARVVSLYRSDLARANNLAKKLVPVAAPVGSDDAGVSAALVLAQRGTDEVLQQYLEGHEKAFKRLADDNLAMSFLNDACELLKESDEKPKTAEEGLSDETGVLEDKPMKTAASKTAKANARSSKTQKSKPAESKVEGNVQTPKSPKRVFEPIPKSVYNRLPRNLKIRAGKLPDVNAFYEKVFGILEARDAPLHDKELMAALGESSMQRFDVLRGLAVLRCGKQGWQLAGNG